MAKRKRIWNREKYHRYLSEGRGQGTASELITIQGFF